MKAETFDQWDYLIKDKSGGELSYKDLVEQILGAADVTRDQDTDLKELDDGPWPLAVRSMYHWSARTLKNPKRDAPKHALVALAEVVVVDEYRGKLLEVSQAARFFRSGLLSILNQGLKRPRSGAQAKWEYPDGIKSASSDPVIPENHRDLLMNHSCIIDEKTGRQEVSALMRSILNHRLALIKPGDPAYVNVLAPEIVNGARELLDVSGSVMRRL